MIRTFRRCTGLLLTAALVASPALATPPGAANVERQGPDQLLVHWTADKPVDGRGPRY